MRCRICPSCGRPCFSSLYQKQVWYCGYPDCRKPILPDSAAEDLTARDVKTAPSPPVNVALPEASPPKGFPLNLGKSAHGDERQISDNLIYWSEARRKWRQKLDRTRKVPHKGHEPIHAGLFVEKEKK